MKRLVLFCLVLTVVAADTRRRLQSVNLSVVDKDDDPNDVRLRNKQDRQDPRERRDREEDREEEHEVDREEDESVALRQENHHEDELRGHHHPYHYQGDQRYQQHHDHQLQNQYQQHHYPAQYNYQNHHYQKHQNPSQYNYQHHEKNNNEYHQYHQYPSQYNYQHHHYQRNDDEDDELHHDYRYQHHQQRDDDDDEHYQHNRYQHHPYHHSQHQSAESDEEMEDPTDCTASFLDGPAVVQMIRPGTNITFEDYRHSFMKYVANQKGQRVDVIFDVYKDDSLKNDTREKRGKGLRQRVTAAGKLPRNWQAFLRSSENKVALFNFLADGLQEVQHDVKTIVTTKGEEVVSNDATDVATLKSKQEEADSRILLHVFHAVQHGHTKILVRTVDTDVVVIAVSLYDELKKIKLEDFWISFGVGKATRTIAIHQLANTLGPEICSGILFSHAFTGCDTVSGFSGKGKKSFWKAWKSFFEVTKIFKELSQPVNAIESHHLDLLSRYVILTYDKTSDVEYINHARKALFIKGRAMDRLPPTFSALLEHTKRACLQAGFIWGQSLIANPEYPNFKDWGWKKDKGVWNPLWSTIKETAASVKELTKCSCRSCITGRCLCRKSGLPCTGLYKCGAGEIIVILIKINI